MTSNKIVSLKQSFVTGILSFTFVLFGLAAATTSYIGIKQLNKEYNKNIIEAAHFIGQLTKTSLAAKDNLAIEKQLAFLNQLSAYNTVHVYHIENDAVTTVSSYDKDYTGNRGIRQIASQFGRKEQLKNPVITGNIIELIQPIIDGNTVIGYLYIQQDISALYRLQHKIVIAAAISMLLVLTCFIYLAIRLHRKTTYSIKSIANTVQQVSSRKAFELRCEQQPTKEFEFLSRNINTLLARVERHVQKQSDAEQQILKLNHELEDKVSQRTDALKESNEELLTTLEKLHQFQGQLVESEKMASLGDMVAGVAHEVNTPIGLGVTASTLLSDRLAEIKTAYEDKTLRSSQLKRFLEDGEHNIAIIYRNLNRAADLISSFKKVAVDQSSEEDRLFNVDELIEEVILTLAPQLKQHPANLDIQCPDNLAITSKPGPLNQILINLIVNSLIHGFEGRTEGNITIAITPLSGQLHIQYKDDGKGVESNLKNKIFDPFITTKRGEGGSGLGLHLVYNLVTQALGGNIQFESELGNGVSFDIIFPVVFHK